ncbi:MAG TPA: O-antigen ligase family protein [Terriglobia bacterium]|nr:O-antigen ligase family protein [Terriglobia bacterium]
MSVVVQPIIERATAAPRVPARQRTSARAASGLHPTAQVLLVATLMAAALAFGAVEAWASTALAILTLGGLVLWAIASLRQGVVRALWSPIYIPALLFLLLVAVQYFARLTADRDATREALLDFAVALVIFGLAGQLFQGGSVTATRRLGLAVAVFTSALSLFAILQSLSRTSLIYWTVKSPGETFGPYVNRNHYAGLMEMLIPLTASYAFSRDRSHLPRLMRAAAVLLPIASVLLSGSRGGLVALVVETALVVIGFLALPANGVGFPGSRRGRRSAAIWFGAVVTAAVALFFWINPSGFSTRLWTVASTKQYHEVTATDRVGVMRDSMHMLKDHLWLGVGLGSFETVYPQYQSKPSNLTWDHAHNDYVEAAVETGLAGVALIVITLVMFFGLGFRNLPVRLGREPEWVQLGATLGCCGLLIHSFVDFNLHVPANAAWFAFCAGLATLPRARLLDGRAVTR